MPPEHLDAPSPATIIDTEPPTRPVRLRSVHERRERRAAEARERATAQRTPWLLRATVLTGLVAAIVVSLVRSGAGGPVQWLHLGTLPGASGASSVGAHAGTAVLRGSGPAGRARRACTVDYAIDARNTSRYAVTVTLTNAGSAPITGWRLRWSLPGGERLTRVWNAAVQVDEAGRTTAEDGGFDRQVAPGATVRFGFTVGPLRPAPRSAFDLDGVSCR